MNRLPRQLANWVPRTAVAGVWLYEGLWAKLLGGRPDERAVLASVPFLPTGLVTAALVLIGVGEVLLAGWVLTGRAPRLAATAQTVALIGFNTGGLVFGGAEIVEPARLLLNNAVLLTLAWLVATSTPAAATHATPEVAR